MCPAHGVTGPLALVSSSKSKALSALPHLPSQYGTAVIRESAQVLGGSCGSPGALGRDSRVAVVAGDPKR